MMFSTNTRTNFSIDEMTRAFKRFREKFFLSDSDSRLFGSWLRTHSGMAEANELMRDLMSDFNKFATMPITSDAEVDRACQSAMSKVFRVLDFALDELPQGQIPLDELIALLEGID